MTRLRAALVLSAVVLSMGVTVLAGCGESGRTGRGVAVPYGDGEAGRAALRSYGCGSCHTIPGVANADAAVGPPLTRFGDRSFIAGELTNTPDNLVRWIMDPKQVEPGTAMPDLDVSREDAQNIAAYLEHLH
jgi:cytochrome c1